MASIAPIAVVVVIWLVYTFKYFANISNGRDDIYLTELFNTHVNLTLYIVYLFLPPIAGKQFRAFNCMRLEDGSRYLRDDTSIDCHSEAYRTFSVVNGLSVAFYQSLPFLYMYFLGSNRHELNPPRLEHETQAHRLKHRDHNKK